MGERIERGQLDAAGLVGDRSLAPWDVDAARFVSVDDCPQLRMAQARTDGDGIIAHLPDGTEVVVGAPSAETAFSSWLGRRIELRPARSVDGDRSDRRVRLVSLSSIAAVAREHPSGQWDVRRFRPHILIVVPGVDFGEDEWVGSQMRIGSAVVEIDVPTACSESWGGAQVGLAADAEIVATVRAAHEGTLGVSGRVVETGTVDPGDAIELVLR